jgi:N-glycosylase/DNA lyase
MKGFEDLKKLYKQVKPQIISRLKEFKRPLKDEEIFEELAFCLLTPQSKAKICWEAIKRLSDNKILLNGSKEEIKKHLNGVRFKNKKAEFIIEARKFFTRDGKIKIKDIISSFDSPCELRKFLVKNIKGMGYKEASHFLRNIGLGDELAILDRHILKNMKNYGVINEIPKSITSGKYEKLEEKFKVFSKKCSIPVAHLDLLLWFKETGEVFK